MTSDGPIRDQFATGAQLESIIETTERLRQEPSELRREILADPQHPRHDMIMLSVWSQRLVCLGARYSLGVSIEELRGHFADAVEHAPFQQWKTGQQTVSDFVEFFWLASWARLLNDTASQDRLRLEAASIGHHDSLLEAVLSSDSPPALSTETLRSAAPKKKYSGLVEAVLFAQQGDHSAATDRFRRYVSAEWYRSFQSTDWWGSHKKMISYKGYWAYEAAAVAHVFGIDDSALRGHKYYPWDLAHPDNPVHVSGLPIDHDDYDSVTVADPTWLPEGFTVVGASDPLQTEQIGYHELAGLSVAPTDPVSVRIDITWGTEPVCGYMAQADPQSIQVPIAGFDAVLFTYPTDPQDPESPHRQGLLWHDTNGAEVAVVGQPDTTTEDLHHVANSIAAITQHQFIDFVSDYGQANLSQP